MAAILALGRRSIRRVATGAVMLFMVLSLIGCAWLDAKQRQLALRPTPGRPAAFADDSQGWRAGDLRYLLPVASSTAEDDRQAAPQTLAIWWLPHADPDAPALLYLHGTFRNLYQNLPKIDALREAGFAVLAVDYRGWGDSSPIIPSEATISADVQMAWGEMRKRQPQAGRRVIFGHSMGGAAAIKLAGQLRHGADYGALVVESTFTSLPDVAAEAGFWGRVAAALTTLRFDSLARIGGVDAPLWMIHGTADKTVPVQIGRRLRDAAPAGAHWVEIPGGSHSRLHSEAPQLYRQAMQDVMKALPPPAAAASAGAHP